MKHEKMSYVQNNIQLSKPISVMWKNCNLFNKLKKQSQESKQQSFTNFKNEAADLIDVFFNVQKKYDDITGDMNYLNKDQSEILASLVPDLLINAKSKVSGYSTTFAGIILFIDISGFTAMCEKYSQQGAEGTDRMTVTLNSYLGPMVYEIYFHGGDVVKFAGDALLAVWKASIYEYTWNLVHSAIVCSKYIQHTFGSYQTDIGIILKVKAAIAAGNLTFSVIGPPNYTHYILVGPPVEELKQTERMCSAGDVLVAPSAWRECSKRNYYYEEKEGCALILRIIYNPNDIKLKFFEFPRIDIVEPSINLSVSSSSSSATSETEFTTQKQDPVRPCLQALYKNEDVKYLQGFVIKQIVQQIEAEQSLDFLTEMRNITTMFVNLIPKQKDIVEKLIQDVNNAYYIISRLVTQSLGSVNLVGLFDKDVMFLVTFGLRGEDHEGETARSLKCAYDIRMALRDKEYVQSISVGVTCGMTYCGIVGHIVRKCYTVLGSTVNKAARLMCYYENKVTCDEQTFKNSNLPLNHFIVQETKQLKGIKDAGIVYEYINVTERDSEESNTFRINSFGIGRYLKILEDYSKFKHFCIITGPQGVGKTNLLKNYQRQTLGSAVIFITLTSLHVIQPYYLIQKIFKKIFGDEKWRNREDTLQWLIGSKKKQLLCYLNPVFQTNFKGNTRVYNQDKVMEAFRTFAADVCEDYTILIDDAQYIDSNSIPFIKEIVDTNMSFVVMTVARSEYQNSELDSFLNSLQGKVIELSNSDENLILSSCCQLIDVVALPKEVTSVLLSRSGGNPGWCNQYLNYLIENGKLAIVERSLVDVKNDCEMVLTDTHEDSAIRKLLKTEKAQVKVAIIVDETTLLPASIIGMIMSSFDRLGPYEQVLLKCAAAMGKEFSFAQLIKALPVQPVENIDRAIKHLLQLNFLQCKTTAVWNEVNHERRKSCFCHDKGKSTHLYLEYFEDVNDLKYCQKLSFKVKVLQHVIYGLMTINQNKIFHLKAFKYLSDLKIRCRVCKTLEQMENNNSSLLDISDIEKTLITNPPEKELNTYKFMFYNSSEHKFDYTIRKLYTISKFENCTCLILKKNYFEILNKHGKKLDKHQKLVSFLVAQAEVLIDLEEKTEAFDITNVAFKHVEEYRSSTKQNIILGRIYIIAGRGHFLDNSIQMAKQYFKKSLDKLNKTLNYQSWGPFKYVLSQQRQVFITETFELKISAYNCLCDVYFVERKIDKVYSYALKAYHTAKRIECKFVDLCLTYTNLIISHNLDYSPVVKNSVNQFAEILCPKNLHSLKLNEVIHIGMVYTAIFNRMLLEARPLDDVLKSGAIALEIARKCETSEVKCSILPLMVSSLLHRGYMHDAIQALNEYKNEEWLDHTQYDILSLDFLLYGGISLSPIKNIIDHARNLVCSNEELTDLNKLLFAKVLLWYLRNKQLEEAAFWFDKLGPMIKKKLDNYVFNITYIHCHILALVHSYNQNDTLTSNIETEIKKHIPFVNNLENKLASVDGFTQLLILINKLYLYKLLSDDKRFEDYLARIKKKCDQTNNVLVSTWIDHCKTVWNEPNHSSADSWVTNSQSDHFDVNQWNISSWSNLMYSLPLTNSNLST